MKMNVIFIPYWSFATSGLSLLQNLLGGIERDWRGSVHEGKHLSTDRERERDDEEHEQCHLCYKQEEDLCANVLAVSSSICGMGDLMGRSSMRTGDCAFNLQDCSRVSCWGIDRIRGMGRGVVRSRVLSKDVS